MEVEMKNEELENEPFPGAWSEIPVKCTCPNSKTEDNSEQECCVKRRLWSVLNSGHSSDVLFSVGRGEKKESIPAIKAILSAGSKVFKTMFSANWSAKSADKEMVEVPDVDPSAFKALLRYLYTDEVSVTCDTVVATLYAARKYDVGALENGCISLLLESLCLTNAFTILKQALLYENESLKKSCLAMIDSDTAAAVSTDGFHEIDVETLCLVLERDTLKISEIELFQAVCRWSESECAIQNLTINCENQQAVLENALSLIRFPLMSPEEFSSVVVDSGLLTTQEQLSMYHYFCAECKPPVRFSKTPRSYQEYIVNRFEKVCLESGWADGADVLEFEVDHDVLLKGCGVYMLSESMKSAKYSVSTELKESPLKDLNDWAVYSSVKRLREGRSSCSNDGSILIHKVFFKKPVKLKPGVRYLIQVNVTSPVAYIGTGGKETVIVDLSCGRKISFNFFSIQRQKIRTTVNKGQIPLLIFSL